VAGLDRHSASTAPRLRATIGLLPTLPLRLAKGRGELSREMRDGGAFQEMSGKMLGRSMSRRMLTWALLASTSLVCGCSQGLAPGEKGRMVFLQPQAYSEATEVEYRVLQEGPCCILDVPPDFAREVEALVQKRVIEALPAVKFSQGGANDTRSWVFEVECKLLTSDAHRLETWPCHLSVIVCRQEPPGVLRILHQWEGNFYASRTELLEALDKELKALADEWKSNAGGKSARTDK
jgi:hypothetical protein